MFTIKPSVSKYFAFTLVALFLAFEMALQVSPSVMTHELMQDLQVDAIGLGLMSSFYYYTYAAMQVPAGILFDRFHVVKLVIIALLICMAGAFCFASSHGLWLGAIARLLMGFGSAFAFVAVLIVAARSFPQQHFALLVGIAQLLAALGAMSGGLPLAHGVAQLGWRLTMFTFMAIGALLILLIVLLSDHFQPQPEQIQQQSPWRGLASVLRNKQLLFTACYACLSWAPMTAFASLWGVPFIQANYGFSPALAASLCSLVWLGVGLGSPFFGWLSDYTYSRRPWLLLFGVIGCAAMLALLYLPNLSVLSVALLLLLLGAASSGQALSFAVVRDNSNRYNRATAIGLNNMAVVVSGALFQPLVGILLHWHAPVSSAHHYVASDYRFALLALPACHLLCLLLGLFFIKETHCQEVIIAMDALDQAHGA